MKIYLATPYSHEFPGVRYARFLKINRIAAQLMQEGHVVFSPISHSHYIGEEIGNGLEVDFWMKQDLPFIDWCDEMVVATFNDDFEPDAFEKSKGVNTEINYAIKIGKPIKYTIF